MKKLTIGLSVAALALAGAAVAQPGMGARGLRADTNGDGIVTRAEAQAHSEKMFAFHDVNKDGKLDQSDREMRRAERRDKMFDSMDTNHDGQISRAEFDAKPQRWGGDGKRGKWGHKRGHYGPGMMMGRMADANNDGAVSQAEYSAAAMKHFDQVDTNGDGKISQEEHQAARDAMRSKWRQGKGDCQGPNAPGN